jgi:hypothetical protein
MILTVVQADICSSSSKPTESIHAVVEVGVDDRFTELDRTLDESAAVVRRSVTDGKRSTVQVKSSRLRGEDTTTGESRFDLSLGAPGSRSRCGALGTLVRIVTPWDRRPRPKQVGVCPDDIQPAMTRKPHHVRHTLWLVDLRPPSEKRGIWRCPSRYRHPVRRGTSTRLVGRLPTLEISETPDPSTERGMSSVTEANATRCRTARMV